MNRIKESSVSCEISVNVSVNEAFLTFTEKFQSWWPQDYTLSKTSLDRIGIEPRLGGFCFEIGPFGFRCDWGRVIVWDPPNELGFTWQINKSSVLEPNPDLASEVSISFKELGPTRTLIELKHYHFERHGETASAYRDEMASEYGWPYILKQYQAALNGI